MRNSNFFIKSALIACLFYSNAAIAADLVITDNSQPTVTINDNLNVGTTDSVIVQTGGFINDQLSIGIGVTIESVQNDAGGFIDTIRNTGNITGDAITDPNNPIAAISNSNNSSMGIINNIAGSITSINNSSSITIIRSEFGGTIETINNDGTLGVAASVDPNSSITTVNNNSGGILNNAGAS